MARFLQLALLVVAGIALAFPQKMVSANPLDAAPEEDHSTGVAQTSMYKGSSLWVAMGDGPSARACGGFTPAGCKAFCASLGCPSYQCLSDRCRCYC